MNISELKKVYKEIVSAWEWESEPEEIEIAKEKVKRLDALTEINELEDQAAEDNTGVSKNLFEDY